MPILMAEMASLLKELQNGTNGILIGQTQPELANLRVNGVAAKANTLIGYDFELGQVMKFNFS